MPGGVGKNDIVNWTFIFELHQTVRIKYNNQCVIKDHYMYKAIKYERKELMGEHQKSHVIYQLCEAVSSSPLTLKSHLFIYLFLKSDIMDIV